MATREYFQKWREDRKAKGICRSCDNPVAPNSSTMCEVCIEKRRAYARKNQKAIYEARKKKGKDYSKFYSLKSGAKERGIDFDLDRASFNEWLSSQPRECRYCGVLEEELVKVGRSKSLLSIDRLDNRKGYSLLNMCLACFRCNNSKSNFFSAEEWSQIAQDYIKPRLAEYHQME